MKVCEMREVEIKAVQNGVTEEEMMENAGRNAAGIIDREIGFDGKTVTIFLGRGNNCGDGLVVARYALGMGVKRISLYFVKGVDDLKQLPEKNLRRLDDTKVEVVEKPEPADVLIDGMLGIGLKGEVRGEFREAIGKFNSMSGKKVALDSPSGIDADSGRIMGIATKPDITIAFHDVKNGCNERTSGKIFVADIFTSS